MAASEFGEVRPVERRATDTMPLPVVETVPAAAPPPTAAMPVAPPPPPPARRDLTPWLLGLLAIAAVVALALSAMALTGDDRPAPGRTVPSGAEAATTTVPPTPAAPTTAPTFISPVTTAMPRATAAPAKEADSKDEKGKAEGKGKDGGKGKD